MIRMHRYPDGRDELAAFCDSCGEQIHEDGFVLWNDNDPTDWIVIHQGRCDDARERRRYSCSMGLAEEWSYLAASAAIDVLGVIEP